MKRVLSATAEQEEGLCVCVCERARDHFKANKQSDGLTAGPGRCDSDHREAAAVPVCYLSCPKFAGAKRIVVS